MNKALLYVRVSTKEQELEGFSLDAQEKLGLEYAKRKGLEIVKRWKVSESAWSVSRTSFNLMIDYAKKHPEIEHIIFDIADRMTRNDLDKMKVNDLIKFYGKTIHFSRSNKLINKDSGSDDFFMLDIEVAVAKKSSNETSKRASIGQAEKAEQGLYPSYAPIGYVNNLKLKTIEIDHDLAPYVRRAFEMVASGTNSIKMVSQTLYKEGFRSRGNRMVDKSSIHRMLHNTVYYGVFTWGGKKYMGQHTPLISKELFDKALEVLQGKNHYSIQRKNFAFTNLMTCGVCGSKVIAEIKKNKHIYYHCTFSKGRHKGQHYLTEDYVAKQLFESISRIQIPEDVQSLLSKALDESLNKKENFIETKKEANKRELERMQRRLDKLIDAKFDKEIDEDDFKRKEKEYKNQIVELKQQLDSTSEVNKNGPEILSRTFELAKVLPKLYLKGNPSEQAKLAGLIASNYTLLNATLCPTYKKPFSFFAKGPTRSKWLGDRDSNPDTMVQSHVSCRWTIPQFQKDQGL